MYFPLLFPEEIHFQELLLVAITYQLKLENNKNICAFGKYRIVSVTIAIATRGKRILSHLAARNFSDSLKAIKPLIIIPIEYAVLEYPQ